jgi:CRP-like cAMP-binding protein
MYYQADLLASLRSIPWFVELTSPQLKKLADIASLCKVKANEYLFLEGGKEDYLYVVLEGQMAVEIHVPTRGCVRIFTAEPLDIVGWSSMTPVVRQRTASARALLPTRLVSLHSESLHKLSDEDHDLGYMIMKRVANVAASRLLTTRLQLLEMFADPSFYPQTDKILE